MLGGLLTEVMLPLTLRTPGQTSSRLSCGCRMSYDCIDDHSSGCSKSVTYAAAEKHHTVRTKKIKDGVDTKELAESPA
jgi:hypothetical protein